tara:strand:+ start:1424 stop:1618 length:195 start_codon:yes stop_codon:yes gene_type:complete
LFEFLDDLLVFVVCEVMKDVCSSSCAFLVFFFDARVDGVALGHFVSHAESHASSRDNDIMYDFA